MRRWLSAPFLFAAVLIASSAGESSRAVAQNKPEEEKFNTADGVRLFGVFHKADKPAPGNPVVILLYQPGAGNNLDKPGDWAGLTKTLNDKGFNVFRFDWRGHGKSKDIIDSDLFWNNPVTGAINRAYIRGSNKKPIKKDFDVKTDMQRTLANYIPVLVNDLAAARVHLDGKNDNNAINTSSIYLIGAGDAAGIGVLWMAAEWVRPAIHPLLGGGQVYKLAPTAGIVVDPEAGQDIAGAVWLSGSRPPSIPEGTALNWSKSNLKLRDNNPMLFLFGSGDTTAKNQAHFYYDQVLVARGNKQIGVKPLEQTFLQEIKDQSGKPVSLKGAALLGNDAQLGTETTIMKYFEARQNDRKSLVRRDRKYPGPYFIDLNYFRVTPP
jgi:pimeloyl-ACP methyl ester carboxylesterase